MLRAALALVASVAAVLLWAAAAGACSCIAISAADRIADRDVTVVFSGVPTSSREGRPADPGGPGGSRIYTFDVDLVYKGNLGATVEVEIAADGGTCGFTPRTGEKIGLALRGPAPYAAGLCNLVSPEELERAASAFPAPLRMGKVAALVAGAFGADASVASIDPSGRILAYGFGRGGTTLAPCPGGVRFVQVDREIVVRSTASLAVVARRRSGVTSAAGARCLSADGRSVAVIGDAPSERAASVVLVASSRRRVLLRGPQPYAAAGTTFALVTIGGEGKAAVHRLDYATGKLRRLIAAPDLPTFLTLAPDGRRAAFLEQSVGTPETGDPTRITVFATSPGTPAGPRRRSVPDTLFGPLVWLRNDRLIAVPAESDTDQVARVYDASLRQLGTTPRWDGRSFATVGSRLLSLDGSGRFFTATPLTRAADMLRVLPVAGTASIAAVSPQPRVAGASARVPRKGTPAAQEARARASTCPRREGSSGSTPNGRLE